ncbi:hypothetical protein ACJW30_11G010600 [Castanea mollissima]
MLDDAEERHAVKQRKEKLLLGKLQNQYYEMDDILDKWSTARIRAEIEKEEGKPADTNAPAVVKKKVGDEFLGIEDSKNKKDYDIIFPYLKSLEFWGLDNWEEWIGLGGTGEEEEEENPIIIKTLPRLQSLSILGCDELKSLPDYVLTAPLLKELEISSSGYGSWLLEDHYQRDGENWHKISHISNIKLGRVYVQRDGEPQFDSKSNDDQHNESGSEISDKDDVGACSVECVVDERVEVDNDEGPEIYEADR